MENFPKPPLDYLFIVWSAVTLLWIVLLLYRGVMENREADQLYITGAHDRDAADQSVLIRKVTKLGKPIWMLGTTSCVLLAVMIDVWLWIGMQQRGT